MKILIATTTFPRFPEDKIPQFLSGYTRALVQAGAQVTVIAPHDDNYPEYEMMNGVVVRRVVYWLPKSAQKLCYGAGIPTNVRRNKWLAFQFPVLELAFLRAMIQYGRSADIFNPHWTFAAFPAVLAAKLLRKPVVPHAYTAEFVPDALRPVNRFILNNSAAVISISDYAARQVEKIYTPDSHEVIGYGVNPEKIAPAGFDCAAFRRNHDIDDDELLVFSVGRLVERKGYHVLIAAIEKMVSRGYRVRLLHSGRGPLLDEIQQQIKTADLENTVQLLGFVADERLRYYLKAADVLVMPSIMDQSQDTEGLGIPLLEAMANGTPAVGSAIGGILSIIEDGSNGLLFPPGDVDALVDCLRRIQTDDALRARLIAGGYETISTTYDWGHIAARTLTTFERSFRK